MLSFQVFFFWLTFHKTCCCCSYISKSLSSKNHSLPSPADSPPGSTETQSMLYVQDLSKDINIRRGLELNPAHIHHLHVDPSSVSRPMKCLNHTSPFKVRAQIGIQLKVVSTLQANVSQQRCVASNHSYNSAKWLLVSVLCLSSNNLRSALSRRSHTVVHKLLHSAVKSLSALWFVSGSDKLLLSSSFIKHDTLHLIFVLVLWEDFRLHPAGCCCQKWVSEIGFTLLQYAQDSSQIENIINFTLERLLVSSWQAQWEELILVTTSLIIRKDDFCSLYKTLLLLACLH